jgi:acyl-CoA thioester hydrolase
MLKPYFPVHEGQPKPLRATARRRVRFEEVDPLGIVWHGRYPSYFEDARVALGDKYGVGYLTLFTQGILSPIKKMHIDYHRPLRFGEEFTVEGILHWSETPRINYEFIIRNGGGEVTTTGYTVQLLLDRQENLLLMAPPFWREFQQRWQAGELD